MVGVIPEAKGKLLIAINFMQYQNCWISDVASIDIMKYNLGYNVTKSNLTKAFNKLTPTTPSWKVEIINAIGYCKMFLDLLGSIMSTLAPQLIKIIQSSNG